MIGSQVDGKDTLYGWRVRPGEHDHMILVLFMNILLLLQSMCFQHKAVMVRM